MHCWKDYREHLVEIGREYSPEHVGTYYSGNKTCMLEAGHEGEHDFVADSSIVVTFKE